MTFASQCLSLLLDSDAYAIEQQIANLTKTINDKVILSLKSGRNKNLFETEIHKLSDQTVVLRGQLELARSSINSNEKTSME